MRQLIIELTNKEGARIERMILDSDGLTIGRAWNSDVIVQDRFIDADHLGLSLDDDKQILISDFDTTNGSRLGGKRLSGVANPYRLGDVVTIGDTRIKIFDAETSVAATALRSKWFLLAERFGSAKALSVLTLLAILAELVQSYSTSAEPLKTESALVAAFGVVMLLLVWSLSLGFIARLLRGQSNIRPLWVLGCLGVIIANVLALILLLVRFNLQNIALGEAISLVVFGIFASWLLVGVLSYVSHFMSGQKWLFSVLLVSSLYAVAESDEYLKQPYQTWKSWTNTEQATLPPVFLLRDGVSLEEYLEETNSLFDVHDSSVSNK